MEIIIKVVVRFEKVITIAPVPTTKIRLRTRPQVLKKKRPWFPTLNQHNTSFSFVRTEKNNKHLHQHSQSQLLPSRELSNKSNKCLLFSFFLTFTHMRYFVKIIILFHSVDVAQTITNNCIFSFFTLSTISCDDFQIARMHKKMYFVSTDMHRDFCELAFFFFFVEKKIEVRDSCPAEI